MVSSRNPETMTPAEREDEIASILAQGLVRAVRANRTRILPNTNIDRESRGGGPARCRINPAARSGTK
jgi:hypothetical protein